MKLRRITALLLAAMLLAGLAGCVNPGPSGDPGQTQQTGKPLQLWLSYLGKEGEVIERVTEEQWNKEHPDMPVDVTMVPGNSEDFYQKLSTAFAVGNGPDMFTISTTYFEKYLEADIAYPVTEYMQPHMDDYRDVILDALTYDGEMIAFPGNMDVMGLYCSKEAFREAGLDYPTTWEELINAANQLANSERYGLIMQTDPQSGYQLYEFYPFLWMNGGTVFDENGQCVIGNEAGIRTFEFYKELMNAPGVSKKVESSNTDIGPFGQGRTAMQMCGSWAVSWLSTNYPDMEYVVVPYPVPEEGMPTVGVSGGWHFMVSNRSSRPEQAAQYLDWLVNEGTEIQTEICQVAAKISPRYSIMEANKEFYSEYPWNVFIDDILPYTQVEPAFTADVLKYLSDGLQGIIYAKKDITQTLTDVQAQCNEAMGK